MNPHVLLTDEAQIRTVESIKRLSPDGKLYYMESVWDYNEIPEAFRPLFSAGCSTFLTKNLEGTNLFCRNYDYTHKKGNDRNAPRTGLNVVVRCSNPSAKYKSIGVSDATWLDWKNLSLVEGSADDGVTDLSAFVMLPYLCMDGVNEKGLAVSIMALSLPAEWEETDYETYMDKVPSDQDPLVLKGAGTCPETWQRKAKHLCVAVNHEDKKAWIAHMPLVRTEMEGKRGTILHPILMRMMLDNCASVDEAVAMADMFNVSTIGPGQDYHIMVADSSGEARLLEWVDNRMNVIETKHATNYRRSADDVFHGVCPRDELIKAFFLRCMADDEFTGMREDLILSLMNLIRQDPDNGHDRVNTQYSCIYDLDHLSVKVYSFGDFSNSWDFVL
jgi:choloylglycine hydrolase